MQIHLFHKPAYILNGLLRRRDPFLPWDVDIVDEAVELPVLGSYKRGGSED
jgi:hypothetical protein